MSCCDSSIDDCGHSSVNDLMLEYSSNEDISDQYGSKDGSITDDSIVVALSSIREEYVTKCVVSCHGSDCILSDI